MLGTCALAAGLAAADARPLAAQETDTLRAPADTVPVAEPGAQDTVEAPPPEPPDPLPALDPLGRASFARGVWEWDRPALERLPDLTLLDLLERIPGVVPIRPDIVNHSEAGTVFGATAGAIRYVLDGFEMDPLAAPTFESARIPLLSLDRVRVERRVTGATVHIETLSSAEPEARSIIEAGTGDFNVQLFRGMFLAPEVLGGALGAGFERLGSNGVGLGTSNTTGGWLKWSWVRDSVGLQVEYRQGGVDRVELDGPLTGVRRDWVVRGRAARGPITGELYAGASSVEDERDTLVIREGSPHAGGRLRARLDAPVPAEALAAVRLRDHPHLPIAEVELGVRAAPLPFLGLEAEAVRGWWDAGAGTGRWAARAQAGPVYGLTAFTELFRGGPLLGAGSEIRADARDSPDLRVSRNGLRAGAMLERWGGRLAVAVVRARSDTVTGLGFAAETTAPRLPGSVARGFEVMARLPTGWDPLAIEGWYVGMTAPDTTLYLPEHHWRAGLVYHHLPLASDNLEIFARVQHVFRGRMTVPGALDPEAPAEPAPPTDVFSYRATDLELSIRVITVRAFLRWRNMFDRREQQDLPLYFHPGQHVLYGVKWEFRN